MKFLEEKKERMLELLKLKLRKDQNKLYGFLTFLWFIGCIYYVYESLHIEYPTQENPIVSYFEENGSDLKYIYCSLLQKAQSSIFISSFGMTDPDILRILKEKKAAGLRITYHNSKEEKKKRKKSSGLYHRKILIIDDEELYIGSANCSITSLCFHGNQILGFFDKELITAIKTNQSHISNDITLYLLPADSKEALDRTLKLLQGAKQRVLMTMYSLTHPQIIDEIISARNRGLQVDIYLDHGSSQGTCKKYIQKLLDNHISVRTRRKLGLLHHKSVLIDDTYILGSTNFSKAGFGKNEETLIIIPSPKAKLKSNIERFFKNTAYTSSELKYAS
jgi:phosphatidylserine/phosphatidylglycerophosphate/cardiolipin synthase-like enzyme